MKSIDDLRPNTLYCIIAKHSFNVLKLDKTNVLNQLDSQGCSDGSEFEFIDSEVSGKDLITRIMDKESYNFLGVNPPKENVQLVQGMDRNGKSNWQKWKISETDKKSQNVTWLMITNLGNDYVLDVARASKDKVKMITYFDNSQGDHQLFALRVMKKLE